MTIDERLEKLTKSTEDLRELVHQLALIAADHEARFITQDNHEARITELERWRQRMKAIA